MKEENAIDTQRKKHCLLGHARADKEARVVLC
jgi:hypothetical protein